MSLHRTMQPQVALLTTLPPLVGSSAQIFSEWLGDFFVRKRLVIAGRTVQALLWLPILPCAAFSQHAVTTLLGLYPGANNFAALQWTSSCVISGGVRCVGSLN